MKKRYSVGMSVQVTFIESKSVDAWDEDHAREIAEKYFAENWQTAVPCFDRHMIRVQVMPELPYLVPEEEPQA